MNRTHPAPVTVYGPPATQAGAVYVISARDHHPEPGMDSGELGGEEAEAGSSGDVEERRGKTRVSVEAVEERRGSYARPRFWAGFFTMGARTALPG